MKCAWKELLAILPPRIRSEVHYFGQQYGQELRLREGKPLELVLPDKILVLSEITSQEDMAFVINAASGYSPWAAQTLAKGYLTAPGGHRIGVCGDAILEEGRLKGFHSFRSICIRVARDFEGIAKPLALENGSVLILGAPGWGKTTLLRDLIRSISEESQISVVDERGELFPPGFTTGSHTDILSGCPKQIGIEQVLRTMGPGYIAVDEITAQEDCVALLEAANCGVRLLATVHASSMEDFQKRRIYQTLWDHSIFDTYVVMSKNKTWHVERKDL